MDRQGTSTQHRKVDKCYTENEECAVAVMLPELNMLKSVTVCKKRSNTKFTETAHNLVVSQIRTEVIQAITGRERRKKKAEFVIAE
jgi:hypothetical protein